MTWRRATCWVLLCDRCDDGWADPAGLPHFESRDDAVQHALADGWAVTTARVLCPQCALCDACSIGGHKWSSWIAAGPFPSAAGGTWHGRVRYCLTCGVADWDPPVRSREPHDAIG